MFKHYIKIAWRNLLKYKTQSVISILGLTMGVVFFAYGYHWYKFETTYDSFYPDSDRIYHLYGTLKSTGKQIEYGRLPYIAAEKMTQAFSEIESVAVVYPKSSSSFKHIDRDLGYPDFEFVDERFFQMFPPKVIAGEIDENSLKNKDELVVTESYAREYFGTPEEAIGETLVSAYNLTYIIKTVIADSPVNSIFQIKGYLPDYYSRSMLANADEKTQWRDFHDTRIYVKLADNIDLDNLRKKLNRFAIENEYNKDLTLDIKPLSLVRFSLKDNNMKKIDYDLKYIRMFIFVGLLLLCIALFNFLNMLHSNTVKRFREFNVRRVTGASIGNIYRQLFVEISLIIAIVALLSLCCIELTSGLFGRIFKTAISSNSINIVLAITILLTTIFLVFMTFILLFRSIKKSSFKNTNSKGSNTTGKTTLMLQIIISSFAIMSAFVTWRQVNYMNNVNWGFDTNNLLRIEMKVRDRAPLMEEIKKLPMVDDIISSNFFTIYENADQLGPTSVSGVEWDTRPMDFNPHFQMYEVGENFFDKMKLKITIGRGFTNEDFTRGYLANKVVINKRAQKIMKMDNPIGQTITVPANWFTSEGRGKDIFEIVGVVDDFHSVGLQSEIPPLIIKGVRYDIGYFNYVRVIPGMEEEAMKAINSIIPDFRPENINENLVLSMNQIVSNLSKNEKNQLKLFTTLAIVCIIITVFGIYSVSQLETRRRRKEIAIRKTAGAKSNEVMSMFFHEYLNLTLIASVLSLPLSWLFMEQWLRSFAYRISITWWMFIVVFIVVAAIVILTILTQVFTAANQNPAEVVKSE
jgi:putative ABC transport system permease protein